MKKSTVAKRFAQALIDIGKEDNSFKEYGEELRGLASIFDEAEGKDIEKLLLNPMYSAEERRILAEAVSKKIGLSEAMSKFFSMTVEKQVVHIIGAMADVYSRLEDELSERVRAQVEAPTKLSDSLLDSIKAKLKAETGKDVVLTFKENKELIGGLVVRVGDTILDGSVKAQLENIKDKLLEGVV